MLRAKSHPLKYKSIHFIKQVLYKLFFWGGGHFYYPTIREDAMETAYFLSSEESQK